MRRKNSELAEELLSRVHATEHSLIEAAAIRWCFENMGKDWPEHDCHTYSHLMECFLDVPEEDYDEAREAMEEEWGEQIRQAKECVAVVRRHGLPLTLSNMERAWEQEIT